ncbi:MFS transporter [Schlesneria sp. DSM 10557]|uniref:MFS transporter n=1 Tax=Schlesneria sp. DSM 10557 TaxID=3044399 RepID=UPI0035A150F8
MSRKPLFIIFVTVVVDLLGFGIVLPLLPRYAEHFLPTETHVAAPAEAVAVDVPETVPGTAGGPVDAVEHAVPELTRGSEVSKFWRGMILGGLMASFSAMQFLFAPLWGSLSDRVGRRPVLLVGLAGSTLFYILFALITQWGNSGPVWGLSPVVWLFVTRMGAGIAGATIPTAQAYIADCTDQTTRGKGMAIIGAAFGIGFTFGPLLGAWFVPDNITAAPSAAPGYVAAVLSGIAFLLGVFLLPESLKAGERSPSSRHGWQSMGSVYRVLTNRVLGPIIFAVFLTTFAFGQFETTLAMLTKKLAVSDRGNFYIFAYIGLILTLAQGLLVRRLIPKMGEYRMAVGGVILMTIGLLLVGQAATASSLTILLVVLPIVVIGFSATTPSLQSMLSLNTGDDVQGEVLGVGQSISSLARIAGPVVGMVLQERNLSLPYWFAAALMAFGAVMVSRLKSLSQVGKELGATAPADPTSAA